MASALLLAAFDTFFKTPLRACVDKASDYLSQENLSPAAIGARHTGFSWLFFCKKNP